MARISAATKEQVRSRLLETAAAQFAEKGLDGANVDSVAVGAGFGKATPRRGPSRTSRKQSRRSGVRGTRR